MERRPNNPPRVNEVRELNARGPWVTKSHAQLHVLLAFNDEYLRRTFFSYDKSELQEVPEDIRGLRIFTVRGIPLGGVGGYEFHKVRQEVAYGLDGELDWICEDLYGDKMTLTLDASRGVYIPPWILHSYKAKKQDSGVIVVANTLFNPDDPRSHDSQSKDEFAKLKL